MPTTAPQCQREAEPQEDLPDQPAQDAPTATAEDDTAKTPENVPSGENVDDCESVALVPHAEPSGAPPPTPPSSLWRGVAKNAVRDIADYRAAAKLKYEQAKGVQQARGGGGAGPVDLKSLQGLLRRSFQSELDKDGAIDEARAGLSLHDAPGVHKSEDIGEGGVSCSSSPASSSPALLESLDSPDDTNRR